MESTSDVSLFFASFLLKIILTYQLFPYTITIEDNTSNLNHFCNQITSLIIPPYLTHMN